MADGSWGFEGLISMWTKSTQILVGLILFLAGGALIAVFSSTPGMAVGTTFGIAGVGLMAWGWFREEKTGE